MSANHTLRPLARALALLLTGLLLATACGKREWPAPVSREDRFRWRSIEVLRGQGCLILNCEVTGSWQNLDTVNVLLEPVGTATGDGCPTCPFSPRITLNYGPGAPGLRREMNRLAITACDLDPAKTYRVQVVGFNIFQTIRPETSELLLSAPNQ